MEIIGSVLYCNIISRTTHLVNDSSGYIIIKYDTHIYFSHYVREQVHCFNKYCTIVKARGY